MCEIFAVCGKKQMKVNDYLKEFFSHSVDHPNGWGIAVFYGNAVSLEKEPLPAYESYYLKHRLRYKFEADKMMAHIRYATKGNMDYENCHPFVKRDNSDRAWTLMHNGTIFDCDKLDPYVHTQEGKTDSERILCYIIDLVNKRQDELGRALSLEERFALMDQVILDITPGNNKVNLIAYDGEMFYVHTNLKGTLYKKEIFGSSMFSTTPLVDSGWKPVTFMRLEGYQDDKCVMSGTPHQNEYIYDQKQMNMIFLDSAEL